MLKKRVIVLLTLAHGRLMRTKRFRADRWYSLEFVDLGGFDEAVCINLTPEDRATFVETVQRIGDAAMIPITVGGGIASVDDVSWALGEMPAEKVVVETGAGAWMEDAAAKYGQQTLVMGDTVGRGGYPRGCAFGEVLIQNVDRDGSLEGYSLASLLPYNCPVVIGSGCGTVQHMIDAFTAGADGCATSCIHHFTANAVAGFKAKLKDAGIAVR